MKVITVTIKTHFFPEASWFVVKAGLLARHHPLLLVAFPVSQWQYTTSSGLQ